MKYTKPFLSFEAQADLLISRGLIADRNILILRLKCVSYYRLSGYALPFRLPSGDFIKGTTLEVIWQRYVFDRKLRMLIIDAIERVEIGARSRIAHEFAQIFGAFGYISHENLPGLENKEHTKWLNDLREDIGRSGEIFVQHFKVKYDEEEWPPIWMLIEIMTFGKTIVFYEGIRPDVRKRISRSLNIPEPVFFSWLRTLHAIRNICAHHSRVWDKQVKFKPKLPYPPNKHSNWYKPIEIPLTRIFAILTILRFLLREFAPTSLWHERLIIFLRENSNIPLSEMGFPSGWEQSPLWRHG